MHGKARIDPRREQAAGGKRGGDGEAQTEGGGVECLWRAPVVPVLGLRQQIRDERYHQQWNSDDPERMQPPERRMRDRQRTFGWARMHRVQWNQHAAGKLALVTGKPG